MNTLSKKRNYILIASHIGYPWGGVSQRYSDLLASALEKQLPITFVETSGNKQIFASTGKATLTNFYHALGDIYRFVKTYINLKPGVVHIATAHGASFLKHSVMVIFAASLGSKVILAPHCSLRVFIPENNQFFRRYMFFILKKCKGMIVLSSEWLSLSSLLPDLVMLYLPNAINCTKYLNIERTDNKSIPVNILYLGHIGKEKGSFDLIYAAKILRDKHYLFGLSLYGESLNYGEVDAVKSLIVELGLSDFVKIHSPIFEDEKVRAFRNADIYLLPSYHEGMPISIIEAMASGLPIVATSVGGIPDLITSGENGFLVPVSSPEEIANSLITLICNKPLRLRMGRHNREIAISKHEINQYVEKLVSYYEKVSL